MAYEGFGVFDVEQGSWFDFFNMNRLLLSQILMRTMKMINSSLRSLSAPRNDYNGFESFVVGCASLFTSYEVVSCRFIKDNVIFFTVSLCLFLCLFGGTGVEQKCWAQQNTSVESGPLFVPSSDVDSPVFFSSVDAARRNRPPQPAKVREDLFYPDGFLTFSSPTVDRVPKKEKEQIKDGQREDSETSVKNEAALRPLDPNVETTPSVIPQVNTEPVKKHRDNVLFFVISVALAGLGGFLYYDYRYRNQLKGELVQNAKLCSANAVASDFDDVLAKAPDMIDPRGPSYVEPTFNPVDLLDFNDQYLPHGYHGGKNSLELAGVSGPGLEEENMDFVPRGASFSQVVPESEDDFTVGENKLT